MQEIKIRNKRNKGWFYLDNEYLNGYARLMNPLTTLIYVSLCRHADNEEQTCYPSMDLIATECNINKRTVMRSIKELSDWNIISVEKSKREDGTQANNIYTLLDKSVWRQKPSDSQSPGLNRVTTNTQPGDCDDINRVTVVHHKDTHINYTHIKETNLADTSADSLIPEVIKEMEKIDIKNKTYYGNKTQRAACKFLIENYGYEKVIEMIGIIADNRHKIFNVPTSPLMLRDNWVRVLSEQSYKAYQNKAKKPQVIYT